ncbi:MAG: NADH-quinone oxidoreductase subunit M, partial [Candidatus Aminicenantes bacterium]|nr:NADH-quinone oxidoreductase subunit M [Candidatus Aminicenantes bacterium]
ATFFPLVVLVFWIGIFPKPFLNVLDKPVEKVIRIVNPEYYKDAAAALPLPAVAPAAAPTAAEMTKPNAEAR